MLMGVVVVLLATACQSGVWAGDPAGAKVAVIGDSLVFQAEGNFTFKTSNRYVADDLIALGYQSHVSGWIGATLASAHQYIWPEVSGMTDLDVLVLALGTNDMGGGTSVADARATLDAWLDEAAGVGCIALVGVNVHAYAWGLDVTGPPYNAMLADEAATRDHVIYEEWDPDLAIQGTDGDVHFHTPEAAAQYRATLVDAANRCAATLPA
jgi:hypothetical protein